MCIDSIRCKLAFIHAQIYKRSTYIYIHKNVSDVPYDTHIGFALAAVYSAAKPACLARSPS